jgi:hypothetical protein
MHSENKNYFNSVSFLSRIHPVYVLFILYGLISFSKSYLIYESFGPRILGDEAIYRMYANAIFNLSPYQICNKLTNFCGQLVVDPLYPPGYPAFLAIVQFFTSSDLISTVKIANVLVSTLAMFPIYGITRRFCKPSTALIAAIVSGVVPFSFFFSASLMSENLFIFVYFVLIYLAVRSPKYESLNAFMFGMMIAFNFLTKYIFLISAPFIFGIYIFSWWSRSNLEISSWQVLRSLIKIVSYVFFGIIIIESIWLIYAHNSNINLQYAFGFQPGLSGSALVGDRSIHLLLLYTVLHFCALIVAILPILFPILIFTFDKSIEKSREFKIYAYFVLGNLIFLWLFTSHYIWVAAYLLQLALKVNIMDVQHLLHPISERYFVFNLVALLPIVGVTLESIYGQAKSKEFIFKYFIIFIFGLCLSQLALKVLFSNAIWDIPITITNSWAMSPGIHYAAIDEKTLLIYLFLGLIFFILIAIPSEGFKKGGFYISSKFKIIFLGVLFAIACLYQGMESTKVIWSNNALGSIGCVGLNIGAVLKHKISNLPIDNQGIITVNISNEVKNKILNKIKIEPTEILISYWLSYWTGRIVAVNFTEINVPIMNDSNSISLNGELHRALVSCE